MRGLGTMACETPDKVGEEGGTQLALMAWSPQDREMVLHVPVIRCCATDHHRPSIHPLVVPLSQEFRYSIAGFSAQHLTRLPPGVGQTAFLSEACALLSSLCGRWKNAAPSRCRTKVPALLLTGYLNSLKLFSHSMWAFFFKASPKASTAHACSEELLRSVIQPWEWYPILVVIFKRLEEKSLLPSTFRRRRVDKGVTHLGLFGGSSHLSSISHGKQSGRWD